MKKFKLTSKAISCIAALSMMASISTCGEEDDSKQIRIIGKSKQASIYWDVVKAGAAAAGEDMGYDVEWLDPESAKDIEGQIAMINKAVEDKVDGIAVAPINANDINEAMQNAKDSGLSVITIDSKSSLDDMVYIGTDNNAAGKLAGTESLKILSGSKKIAIVALTEDSALAVRWHSFEEAVTSDSDVSIVETTYCHSDKDTAKQQAAELIEKYPDLEMIFGVNQTTTIAICEAVEEKGLAGKIKVVGYDSAESEIEYINKGILAGTVVQNPYNIGYLGVKSIADMSDGDSVSTIDTGTTFVTADNMNDETVQLLLYPLK